MAFLGLYEGDDSVFRGVDGEVAGHVSALASDFGRAGLADENFAVSDFLASEAFYTESCAGIIVNIFGGTACFYV